MNSSTSYFEKILALNWLAGTGWLEEDELKNFISRFNIFSWQSTLSALKFFRPLPEPAAKQFTALIFSFFCIKTKGQNKMRLMG